MKPYAVIGLLAGLLALVLAGGARAADWGNLKGRFVYDGKAPTPDKINPDKDQAVCGKHNLVKEELVVDKDGGLANVVVYLRTDGVAVHPDYEKTKAEPVVQDNKDCRFQPHISVVRVSQGLVLKNSDPMPHNSKIDSTNVSYNPLIAVGGEFKANFKEKETLPVPLSCSIHSWMKGYIVVRDDPYAIVSDEKGNFEIKNLPAGKELEFQLWQEKSGYLKDAATKLGKADARGRIKITLKPGDNDLGDVKLPPKLFAK